MFKTSTKGKRAAQGHFNLYNDLEKIKAVLSETTYDVFGNIKDKSEAAQESIASYVYKKPVKSLGLAVLSGIIIGILFRR